MRRDSDLPTVGTHHAQETIVFTIRLALFAPASY